MPRRTPPRPVLRRNGGPFRVFPVVLQKIVGRHAEELRQSHNLLHVGRRLSALSFRNGLATHPKLFGKLLLGPSAFLPQIDDFFCQNHGILLSPKDDSSMPDMPGCVYQAPFTFRQPPVASERTGCVEKRFSLAQAFPCNGQWDHVSSAHSSPTKKRTARALPARSLAIREKR